MTSEELRERLKKLGLSPSALAAIVGVSARTVDRWQKGELSMRPATSERVFDKTTQLRDILYDLRSKFERATKLAAAGDETLLDEWKQEKQKLNVGLENARRERVERERTIAVAEKKAAWMRQLEEKHDAEHGRHASKTSD